MTQPIDDGVGLPSGTALCKDCNGEGITSWMAYDGRETLSDCVGCGGVGYETDPLAELRAEVERLRDKAAHSPLANTRGLGGVAMKARADAYQIVLDLIDKREGQ